MEAPWSAEVIRLRRWLAEDRLQAGDEPHQIDTEARSSSEGDVRGRETHATQVDQDGCDEGDVNALMQGGKPPWRPWWSSTSRGARDRPRTPRRRRRHRQRARDAEREVERTNEHQRWRRARANSNVSDEGPRDGGCASGRSASGKGSSKGGGKSSAIGHPATVHAWHCLLNMTSATTTPDQIDYGLVGSQHDNVMESWKACLRLKDAICWCRSCI